MKCPHCQVHIHPEFDETYLRNGQAFGFEHKAQLTWKTSQMVCPSCQAPIIYLLKNRGSHRWESRLVNPFNAMRPPAPPEVPETLATDYNEAGAVLTISPKASAALSRRCLQHLLKMVGFNHHELSKAIGEAISTLPSTLAENLDAIRNIGNFAAHPTKDRNFGEIMDVEPHEAEWNLEVLDSLFDYYFVQPEKDRLRRDALNEKLKSAGKSPMKQPD